MFNDGDEALKSIFRISLAANKLNSSNYTIKMLSYTASKVVRTESNKKIGERTVEELLE